MRRLEALPRHALIDAADRFVLFRTFKHVDVDARAKDVAWSLLVKILPDAWLTPG